MENGDAANKLFDRWQGNTHTYRKTRPVLICKEMHEGELIAAAGADSAGGGEDMRKRENQNFFVES